MNMYPACEIEHRKTQRCLLHLIFIFYLYTCMYVLRADLWLDGALFPGEDNFSCSQHSLVAHSSFFRVEVS